MPEYDHVIKVKCDGNMHRLGVRKRPLEDHLFDDVGEYIVEMLDHDPEMIAGFTAFGAKPPLCHRLAKPMERAINAYHATPAWWWVEWSTEIGSNRIDIDSWSSENIKEELARVEKSEERRLRPLQKKLNALAAELEATDRGNYYIEDEINRVELRIEDEQQLYWDWQEALDYAETVEKHAMASARAADAAYEQLLKGNITNAWEAANKADKHARAGDNHDHWDKFLRALSELHEFAQ
jgi:hypothetical protein